MKISKQTSLWLGLGLALLTSACKPDNPIQEDIYQVPEIIEPYIELFEMEAAARGFNITIDSVIVEFASDLNGGDAAGLCTFATHRSPIPHISLDTTSFNWTNNEYHREILVFHELGHCILDRREHRDDLLPNGNIASIMRSTGEQVYGGSLNYYKRDYYLDELFDPSTPAPDWATDFPTYAEGASFSRTPVLLEEFDDNSNGWSVGSSDDFEASIENGRFFFQSKSESAYFNPIRVAFDMTQDFEIETSMKIASGTRSVMLQWGGGVSGIGQPNGNDLSFYGFAKDTIAFIGQWETGVSISNTPRVFLPEFNKITIRKIGTDYHFYFNEEYFDVMKYEALPGDVFAFYVGPFTQLEVEYLNVSLLE